MEKRIRHADKLASAGQLAAGVAHEINNPLSVVLGYTSLLMKEGAEGRAREDLAVIHNNAGLCEKIVKDLLNFARQTRPRYEEADIKAVVESVVSVVESRFSGSGMSITRNYDLVLPQIIIDVNKMKQVAMNLLMNAYQALRPGGLVAISTRYAAGRDGVWIVFSDTGNGILKDIRNRIFEPFFTTKEPGEGTGLRLVITYGIIKEHKGESSCESEEDKGTIFRIWLPARITES